MTDEETGKDPIDVVYSQVMAENEKLKSDLKKALDAIKEKDTKLARANELIDSSARSSIIEELRQMGCTYGVEELDKKSLEDLVKLKTDYKYFNPPFKSGGDFAKPVRRNVHDSLYDLYIPLEKRMEK